MVSGQKGVRWPCIPSCLSLDTAEGREIYMSRETVICNFFVQCFTHATLLGNTWLRKPYYAQGKGMKGMVWWFVPFVCIRPMYARVDLGGRG
jgi:hypothetical protein